MFLNVRVHDQKYFRRKGLRSSGINQGDTAAVADMP